MLIFLLILIGILALLALLMVAATTDRPTTNAAWANVTKWLIIMAFVALIATAGFEALK